MRAGLVYRLNKPLISFIGRLSIAKKARTCWRILSTRSIAEHKGAKFNFLILGTGEPLYRAGSVKSD